MRTGTHEDRLRGLALRSEEESDTSRRRAEWSCSTILPVKPSKKV